MDLFECIQQRRSVRALQPADIADADLRKILDAGRRAPSGYNRQPLRLIVIRDPETIAVLGKCQSGVADVSTIIAVVGDPAASEFWVEDVAAAVENMLLAITSLGLASVWVEGTQLRHEDEFKELLGVPEELRLLVLLPVGKEGEPGRQPDKVTLDEFVFAEKYGNPRK